jgi:hypothetical protein
MGEYRSVNLFFMSHDFEYFTEFLENPSAPEINEFFRMLRQWAEYLEAHEHEFNYLADDDWKEIRERIIAELEIRVPLKDDLEDEWEELNEEGENLYELNSSAATEFLHRKLNFMKTYRYVFDFCEADIDEFERLINDYLKSMQEARIADEKVRFTKLALDTAIAELDEELVKYYERTGKILVLPSYQEKKAHRGN